MKKLLTLSTALLFTAGAAFAQSNNAALNQDGDNNEASIEQLGTTNSAELNQGFDGQGQNGAFAEIYQEGAENEASLNQRAWGNNGNEHEISQLGIGNSAEADIYNGNNGGLLVQEGFENSARMVQSGSGHESLILQSGAENYAQSRATGGSGNQTAIVQGVPGGLMPGIGGPSFDGPQLQNIQGPAPLVSADNAATLKVDGSDNMAGILQIGLGNNAGSNPQWSGDLGIEVVGDGNISGIAQLGIENDATISVMGNSNVALIAQMGSTNTGSVIQDGSGNTAVIVQDGGGFGLPVDGGFPQ